MTIFSHQEIQPAPEQTLCPPPTLWRQICKKMPKISPISNGNGSTEMFLTVFKTAVPGSAGRGRGSSNCSPSVAAGGAAGRAGRLPGRIRLPARGCPWEIRCCPAGRPLGSAGLGSARQRGPRSSNQGRKRQARDACRWDRKGLHTSHRSEGASPSNKAVSASLRSRGWERAPSCSGNAADHFPFPLSAPA